MTKASTLLVTSVNSKASIFVHHSHSNLYSRGKTSKVLILFYCLEFCRNRLKPSDLNGTCLKLGYYSSFITVLGHCAVTISKQRDNIKT